MGINTDRKARILVTGLILLAVVTTAFAPGWVPVSQAAPRPADPGFVSGADLLPGPDRGVSAQTITLRAPQPAALVPLNTLILAEVSALDAIEAAVRAAGDTPYIRSGSALLAGLQALGAAEIEALGARAVFQQDVPAEALAALDDEAASLARAWNAMRAEPPIAERAIAAADAPGDTLLVIPGSPAAGPSANFAPTDQQTSVFMAGDIVVQVLFVESTAGPETWTQTDVNNVKKEVLQALDWWTVAPIAPDAEGNPTRPAANLSWTVNYVSPFDGDAGDRLKIQVPVEPIQSSIAASADNNGWMAQVAAAFTGLPASDADAALRRLAHNARGTKDWAFTLFVVNSAVDADGRFDGDQKVGGAALNGPWAVVTYDGGTLGSDNLEVMIAKMIGHVFGAGNEAYDPLQQVGCHNDELYGYLLIPHDNCERDNADPEPSLMRGGVNMIQGYKDHVLSNAARAQLGWLDSDNDGSYDVIDTLTDSFAGFATDLACPLIHLAAVDILNEPARPAGYETASQWATSIWDPVHDRFVDNLVFTPVNINRPAAVWASLNGEDWVAAQATDGAFDSATEKYSVVLNGVSGQENTVYTAILNRWAQENDLDPDPVTVNVLPAAVYSGVPDSDTYQSDDASAVDLFNAQGTLGLGWTPDVHEDYSGGATMISSGVGSEACFAFEGPGVTIVHSQNSLGSATVYIDGQQHSTISYTRSDPKQQFHTIPNLAEGVVHTVQVKVASGVADVDAFTLTDIDSMKVIDGVLDVGAAGFYENSGAKIQYMGTWTANVAVSSPGRPGTPDNQAHESTVPYSRFYATFTHADTVGIYRAVFPGGGTADLYVDGQLRGTMNNDAKVARVVPHYVGGLDPAATHTIEVRVNPGSPRFDLDALRFLNQLNDPATYTLAAPGKPLQVPFNGAQEVYGDWKKYYTSYLYTSEQGALLSIFFRGSGVAVQIEGYSTRGQFEMYVDGKLIRTVNSAAQSGTRLPIIAAGFDPTLPHVLQIRHVNAVATVLKTNRIYGYLVYKTPVADGRVATKYEESEYDAAGKPTSSVFLYEGGWSYTKYTYEPGPSADRYIKSTTGDARAYFTFTGAEAFSIYGTAGTAYGGAEVWVDGVYQGLMLQRGPTFWQRPFTASGFDPDTLHVVELRMFVAKGYYKKFNVDWLLLHGRPVLGPGTYEDNGTVPMPDGAVARAIHFTGSWRQVDQPLAHGGTYHVTSKQTWSPATQVAPLVRASFDVTGATSVVVYRRLYPYYGKADVYVDGKYHSSFDSKASSPSGGTYQQAYTIGGLDPGYDHTIWIMPQPTGTTTKTMAAIDLDYIVVRATEEPGSSYLVNGRYENDNAAAMAGGAITYAGSKWTHGGVSTTAIVGNKAVVTFYGNVFQTFFNYDTYGGLVEIWIDGKLAGSLKVRGSALDVPLSIVGLDEGLHVAEVILKSSTRMHINAFAAYTVEPIGGPATIDLQPTDPRVFVSGNWTVSGDYRQTKEKGASMFVYVTGVDSLKLTYKSGSSSNSDIKVYVDGVLHSWIDYSTIRQQRDEATYLIAGLGDRSRGHWIKIENPIAALVVALAQLELTDIVNPLGPGQSIEGEDLTSPVLQRYGTWAKSPASPGSTAFSARYFLKKVSKHAHFYIPVQNITYLTVYRPVGSFGNTDIYIDGVFWGTMYNKSGTTRSAPFTIGPIPDPSQIHVVDLREDTTAAFGVDRVVGLGLKTIDMGYYENDDVVFVGGTDPLTGITYDNAYIGSWKKIADVKAAGGSFQRTTSSGARVAAVFMGNKLTIWRHMYPYTKTATVYVDGVSYPLYSYSATHLYQVAHTILLPHDGPHSLEIVNNSGYFDFDAIEFEYIAPAYAGAYQHTDRLYVALSGTNQWTTMTSPTVSGGTYAMTKAKYASAMLMFYGSHVTAYWSVGKDWGKFKVFLDGQFITEFDQYAATARDYYAFDLANLPLDQHVIELRFEQRMGTLGKKQMNFDGFTVDGARFPRPGDIVTPALPAAAPEPATAGCYEERVQHWSYSGPKPASWFTYQNPLASGGKYRQAQGAIGDAIYAEIPFQAAGFSLVYHKGPTGGLARIEVDGAVITTLDMYAPTDQWQGDAVFTHTGLDGGQTHKLRVWFTGQRNPSATGTNVFIDRLDLPAYPACP